MIKRIFIDLDGVLNRFQMYAFYRLGITDRYDDETIFPVECGWQIVSAANKLLGEERYTPASFWRSITREMWAMAPVSEECYAIIGGAEQLVGKKNIAILTSPTLDPECAAGKVEWIQQYLPSWLHRQFFIGPKKALVSSPGFLLIDDSDDNVEAWTAAGGPAILVPRPWNKLHGNNAMQWVSTAFSMYMAEQSRTIV